MTIIAKKYPSIRSFSAILLAMCIKQITTRKSTSACIMLGGNMYVLPSNVKA